jgi:hypothetical protein
MLNECRRLLEGGLLFGIATGRGRSVRDSLQSGLPRRVWGRVWVGYYNGGDVAPLADDSAPSLTNEVDPLLADALELLKAAPSLAAWCKLTQRPKQLTVEPTGGISSERLASEVMTVLAPLEHRGVRVLASSHSVDVLPPGTGKLTVVDAIASRLNQGRQVLCIGDRGAWPGNDCALLSHHPSLSVDEVSSSLTTCWNLAPAGVSGPSATLLYLRAIRVEHGYATLSGRDLWVSR